MIKGEKVTMKVTISHIEVRKVEGKWRVTVHYNETPVLYTLGRYRLKAVAVLVGTGAAKAVSTELRVANRKGQYTKDAASFGNDPTDIPG